MATDNPLARGNHRGHWPASLAGNRRPAYRVSRRPGAVLRSLLLGASVFALAALTGMLLSGAARAMPAEPPGAVPTGRAAPAANTGPPPDQIFAHSMIYTGTAGLTVSVAGLIMVGRRRRLW